MICLLSEPSSEPTLYSDSLYNGWLEKMFYTGEPTRGKVSIHVACCMGLNDWSGEFTLETSKRNKGDWEVGPDCRRP